MKKQRVNLTNTQLNKWKTTKNKTTLKINKQH